MAPSLAVTLDGCEVIENVLCTTRVTAFVFAEDEAPTALITQRYWSL